MVDLLARATGAFSNGSSRSKDPAPAVDTTPPTPGAMKPTEFAKKLRWLIQNPPENAQRWTITPPMAAEMLTWNDENRPLGESLIKSYATQMAASRFPYTGDTIKFSKERLRDGQHRLHACVRSGHCFEAQVAFGVADEAFAFMDIGKKRSASDIFAIHGVKNWALMAAATQWVVGYENGVLGSAAKFSLNLDHAQKYAAYERHAGLQDSAWVGHLFAPLRLVSPSAMTALHYLCAKKSRAQADEFFRCIAEGIGFPKGKKDPAYKLYRRLVDSAVNNEKIGPKSAAAITVKAWNAARLNRPVGTLEYKADEVFPKVI